MSMSDQTVDLRRLADMFAEGDGRMPAIVFTLLRHYHQSGPFPFEPSAIARVLDGADLEGRLNPTHVADLQDEIARYFERGPSGLEPRQGVLA